MTTVLVVTCPTHGGLEIPSKDLRLRVCDNSISRSFYEFDCWACGTVRKPASLGVLRLLWSVGISGTDWTLPLEALEPHTDPALTEDDLIKFGRSLATWDEVTV